MKECLDIDWEKFYIFGDKAYVMRPRLQVGFDSLTAIIEQKISNTEMVKVREAVEYSNKEIKLIWKRHDFSQSLKVRQAPIYFLIITSTVILNFKTGFEKGEKVGACFQCTSPNSDTYVNCN